MGAGDGDGVTACHLLLAAAAAAAYLTASPACRRAKSVG